jgi:hypothetical protein
MLGQSPHSFRPKLSAFAIPTALLGRADEGD